MNPQNLAWLAGFYEGEGTCGFYTSKTPTKRGYFPNRISMSIGQNERAVLEKCKKIIGFGCVSTRTKSGYSSYGCSGTQAVILLSAIRPYLKSVYKRGQIDKALKAWRAHCNKTSAMPSQLKSYNQQRRLLLADRGQSPL